MLRLRRMYATTRSALDVKGIGPLSLLGSRMDSGVCCQREVQERRARAMVDSSVGEMGAEKESSRTMWMRWRSAWRRM
jgi:hypothetical protein